MRCGIPPSLLWDEDPRDLATMIAVLLEQDEATPGDPETVGMG